MMKAHLILALLWIVFCFLHSFLAASSLKTNIKNRWSNSYKYYRLFYTVFAAVTFFAVLFYQWQLASYNIFDPNIFPRVLGVAVTTTGAVIMIICIKKYFMSLSGLNSLFIEPPKSSLMIKGIHRYIRHPLYLGTFLFIWGMLLLLPFLSLLISNIIITVYTLIGIKLEEQKLVEEYGDDYLQYRLKVPKILPFKGF